jgi:hypothetical protein
LPIPIDFIFSLARITIVRSRRQGVIAKTKKLFVRKPSKKETVEVIMFNVRKFMTGFTAIAVSLAMLGVSAGSVFAKSEEANATGNDVRSTNSESVSVGQSVTLQAGREGIDMSKSGYSGELDLLQVTPNRADHMRTPTGIEFVQP